MKNITNADSSSRGHFLNMVWVNLATGQHKDGTGLFQDDTTTGRITT